MLTLRNIRVWDTGDIIDMGGSLGGAARDQPEDGGVIEGDFDATRLTAAPGCADPRVHFRDTPARPIRNTMVFRLQGGCVGRLHERTRPCRTLSPPWTGVR